MPDLRNCIRDDPERDRPRRRSLLFGELPRQSSQRRDPLHCRSIKTQTAARAPGMRTMLRRLLRVPGEIHVSETRQVLFAGLLRPPLGASPISAEIAATQIVRREPLATVLAAPGPLAGAKWCHVRVLPSL